MQDYKKDVRGERNIQPLSDDYIKFIRFAQWKIEQTGKGIVGLISNNSYLSGLIHRGMRKQLFDKFDDIYILNLHGSTRFGEISPDGSKDENVFDIMQGVAIALFVKYGDKEAKNKLRYADLFGARLFKNQWLKNNDIITAKWQKLKPTKPYYFFVPKEFKGKKKYQNFRSLTAIFKKYSSGIKTHRDHFIVGFEKEKLVNRLIIFTGREKDEIVAQSLKLKDTRDWKLAIARKNSDYKQLCNSIVPYSYRAFDTRLICYSSLLIDRGCDRYPLMKHLLRENISLVTTRKIPPTQIFSAFITNSIGDIHLIGDQNYYFPLYLYPDAKSSNKKSNPGTILIFEPQDKYQNRIPNFNSEFIEIIESTYKQKVTPEHIFNYIYAILYSNFYRKEYDEFLKIDFPKIPFVNDYKLFKKINALGKKLIELHLLKSAILKETFIKYPVTGTDRVKKVLYDVKTKRVHINEKQYFRGISKELWEHHIGSYQVLEKWLKDRRQQSLSLSEIEHYMKIAMAIKKTIKIQTRIDKIYLNIEKKIIVFKKK
jgi:predicted helicase